MNALNPSAVTRILIAEDDRAVRESLERALRLEGYEVMSCTNGLDAVQFLHEESVDVVLLDVTMPKLDGIATCRRLRSSGVQTPVMMVTARSETTDRVSGLDAGADDYVVKPFVLEELFARIRALTRRSRVVAPNDPTQLTLDDLSLDVIARRVSRGGRKIELSKTEFDLLEMLLLNVNVVLTQSAIYQQIWGYDFGPDSKNLAVYIGYLRRKTEERNERRLIHTVRGAGYVAKVDA